LAKLKYIEKLEDQTYRLTALGKLKSIMLKPDTCAFIEQGYTAVLTLLTKKSSPENLYLLQARNKVPYKGFLALPGDKVYYGESTHDAALRSLRLQTGYVPSGAVELKSIWHIWDEFQGEIVQD
jgi:ADP-ribose pyrophosphatase YjhB (NUDIX family)